MNKKCLRFGYTDLNQDQLIKASGRISLNKLPIGIGEDDKWQILDGDSLILTVKLDGDMKVSLKQVKKLFENMVV